jgi:hypothetical protein
LPLLNTKIKKLLLSGKSGKGNLKGQLYINMAVIMGFVMFIAWIVFLFPKTFIDIKVVLLLLFVPSLILTPFIYKSILSICGYEPGIKNNAGYNALVSSASYLLVTVIIGNIIVTLFLFINYSFADSEIQVINKSPFNISKSISKTTHQPYTHFEIEWDNVTKRINTGSKPADSIYGQVVHIKICKGLMGYYILRGYYFEDRK